jgi:tetratricopeptide (TPR) repeat protein
VTSAAAILLLALIAQVDGNVDFARQRFQRGLALYDSGAYADALPEFQGSVSLYASPNSELYVARCLRALGRLPEAVTHYERTIGLAGDRAATDPRYQDTRQAAAQELRALEPQIARLRLDVAGLPRGTRVLVADREIPPGAWGLLVPVAPGAVEVRAELPGGAVEKRDTTAPAGTTVAVDLRPHALPVPAAPPRSSWPGHRAWMAASLVTGAAGFVSFATFYLLAARQHAALEDRCRPLPCPPGEQGAIDRGRLYQGLANGSLVVGLVGASAAAALWALSPRERPPLSLAIGRDGVAVFGRF